jgi:uncharacterized protein YpbB
MHVSIDINLEQLLVLIRSLPEGQLVRLQQEISKSLQEKSSENKDKYLEILLHAPTMSEEQYVAYKENRRKINKWRKK